MLDVLFIRNTIEGNVPDRNMEALAMSSAVLSVTSKWICVPEMGLRQRYDLHISCGEQNPCLVDMPERECFRGAVVPECGL